MLDLSVQISADTELNMVSKVNLPEEYYVENLSDSSIDFPLYFEIKKDSVKIYVSVLEFTASENTIEVPFFMTLAGNESPTLLQNDDIVRVTHVRNVINCKSLTLEPQTEAFFEKEDYVSFLENELSKLSILYLGQIFYIFDSEMNNFPIKVVDIKPDEDVNFFEYNTRNQICFSILNQNIDTEIINEFEKQRLIKKREKILEARERIQMQKEDIRPHSESKTNVIQGRRLSDGNSSNSSDSAPSLEDIREARLRRFRSSQKKK